MAALAHKHNLTVKECISRLLSRAENSRGLKSDDLEQRIISALEKYLLNDQPEAGNGEIKEFIDSLRADDLCLIIACEKGDETAWSDIVTNFDASVKSAAFRFAKNKEDAEDLAGSIWAELHGLKTDAEGKTKGKLSYYSGKGSLAGWLRAVTNQLAIDQFRKMKRLVQTADDREFDNLARDSSEKSDNKIVVGARKNPEEQFSERESQKDILEALHESIAGLADEDRLIIKLYYFEGLKLKDIAETFGFHEATASRKMVRIQNEIRKRVERTLIAKHGWNEDELNKYLEDSAEKLGISLEKFFMLAAVMVILQELTGSGVL